MNHHISIRPIHPFPARMVPEVVWKELPDRGNKLRILDPMSGSGTTLVTARLRGHQAVGFDRDPLAVLISNVWVADIDGEQAKAKADKILERAWDLALTLKEDEAYPHGATDETKEFVRFWFDQKNRLQLAALSKTISRLHDDQLRDLMWCALSRLIITKKRGVSLAMDVSHSRPHRKYDMAPMEAFDFFSQSVQYIIKRAPFSVGPGKLPKAKIKNADARKLPVDSGSIDIVITSPPYLNAIDYLRGHKLSLVWMGYSISELRKLRSSNIGSEVSTKVLGDDFTENVIEEMCSGAELSGRNTGMLRQYVQDTHEFLREIGRVLRIGGKAVIVVGNCNLRQTFVRNSRAIEMLACHIGLSVEKSRKRPLPENRRYLPPPSSLGAGAALQKRMREEVILTLAK